MHIFNICTIDLQNDKFLSKKKCRSYPYIGVPFCESPIHHFHHSNNQIFPSENPVNKL